LGIVWKGNKEIHMGGSLDTRVYATNNRAEIERRFSAAIDQAGHESGHGGYTGTIAEMSGIAQFVEEVFDSALDAERYICDEHCKWDDAMAVPFRIHGAPTAAAMARYTKKQETLCAKQRKVQDDQQALVAKIHAAFRAGKSALVGCKGCGSRLSRTHIASKANARVASLNCPVCNSTLLSKTDQGRLEKLQAKHDAARKALRALQSPHGRETGIGYVVGGICSS